MILISDIDDTLKVSEVRYPLSAVLRGLFGNTAVAGMAPLYSAWAANDTRSTPVFVTGSPTFLKEKLRAFLGEHGFPKQYELRTKGFLAAGFEFKMKAFAAVMAGHPEAAGFVLVGDDTESDPELFDTLRKIDMSRIAATYIHRVKGRALFDGQLGFTTAMDLALYELRALRLAPAQALRVAGAILAEGDEEAVLMRWSYCPRADELGLSRILSGEIDERVAQAAQEVEAKVRRICRERAEAADAEAASRI